MLSREFFGLILVRGLILKRPQQRFVIKEHENELEACFMKAKQISPQSNLHARCGHARIDRIILNSFWLAALSWLAMPAHALPPHEPGDGTPVEPCVKVNTVLAQPVIQRMGLPLRGCSVELSAAGSKLEFTKLSCNDPTYYDLPASMPTSWQLISFPAGGTPTFSSSSTLATLSLPRSGTYVVRFTICPSGNCSFRPMPGGSNFPVATASFSLSIVAVDAIPIPTEEYPVLPPSAMVGTMPTFVPDRDCKCQGGGGVVDPNWVTVEPWHGPADYRFLEGTVQRSWISIGDVFINHDTQDNDIIVRPDPPFRNLLSTFPEFENEFLQGVEWESGSIPERFRPVYGDRISVFGFWILDCGHPPFYTEIHPAVGAAVHRPRPILIPSGRIFTFNLPGGPVSSTVGNNVFVPGVLTDIWFNNYPGEITSNCSDTGLYQPGICNTCPPGMPNCPPWLGGDCIEGNVPLKRLYEFNIYLPRNPAVNARAQGVANPVTPPLYISITNPWGFGGPDPVVTQVTEGDVTYLHVSLDLRGFNGNTYSRRIESAWVYPSPDNWSLNRWRVTFRTLDVHDDLDPWTDWPNDDGDYRLWLQINNRDQEWVRVLFGDDNAHGKMNLNPVWQTGQVDPVFWRKDQSDVDDFHRLGPDVLSYPDQGVQIGATAYESDWIWNDDPGRISSRITGTGTRIFQSDKGSYSIHVDVQPGPPVGAATLTTAAQQLRQTLQIVCNSNPPFRPINAVLAFPLDFNGYLVQGVSDQPPQTLEGEQVNAQFGTSVASVGDINRGEFDDILVGAPGASPNGRASIYLGFEGPMSTRPYWTAQGPQPNAMFGHSVAGLGDVNKDGFPDFMVGAPNFSNGQIGEGAAFFWFGSSNGPSATANWVAEGNLANAGYGFAVAAAGDINGDGFADVAVGAPFYKNADSAAVPLGRVFVYFGSPAGLPAVPDLQLVPPGVGNASEHWFGYSLTSADINHDGFSDLVVGAPKYTRGQNNEGAIIVYYGSATGLVLNATTTIEGNFADAQFGYSVSGAGDVDGDGFADVVVGAPFFTFDFPVIEIGSASLFRGSTRGLLAGPAWSRKGEFRGERFGSAVAGVGDLNGDGLDDVVIGSPGFTGQAAPDGRILVFLGTNSPSALNPIPTWIKNSMQPNSFFGAAIAGAGDVDEDGFPDFVVGAPGFSHGQTNEGAVFVYGGGGPREVRLIETEFFESVEVEPYPLFNAFKPDFGAILKASGQDDPAKLGRLLARMRAELLPIMGTAKGMDALSQLDAIRAVVPPNLWQQHFGDIPLVTGGALYLDCGATTETIDNMGRRWKPDAAFLVTSNSNINPFNNQTINISLLTDHDIPNNVLLSERWKDGDLRYEIPVQKGLHTVILYFSENCPACVNTNLGGTALCPTCARLFDIEVEGRRTNSYNPADAARPPMGDGLGATFKSTQVLFRNVMVSDGVLNIAIIDRGTGNPPENAAIDAMAILQSPSDLGLIGPHIESIRRIELNWSVRVGGANMASYLAGLTSLSLEASTDLAHWISVDTTPFFLGGKLFFEFSSTGNKKFFRVVARSLSP